MSAVSRCFISFPMSVNETLDGGRTTESIIHMRPARAPRAGRADQPVAMPSSAAVMSSDRQAFSASSSTCALLITSGGDSSMAS